MPLLDTLPLTVVFVVTLLAVLVAIEFGYRFGRDRRRRTDLEKEAPVGAMVAASLGLLAFLLAFTFGMAASRFDDRRQVQLEEANAIGTTYLRAAFLPEPARSEVRELLRNYVDVRIDSVRTGAIDRALRQAQPVHDRLWEHAVTAATAQPQSLPIALFVESLNETIDVHAKRVLVAVRTRVPTTIWYALYAIAFVALAAMGYHEGLARSSRSTATIAVAVTFSIVLWLITDLDRPREGALTVSQQTMEDLRASMIEPASE
jgi:hypothetical protein